MTPSKDPARLVEIMRALRNPQTGCPWDIEQTFQSIVPYTLEEAHEVAQAIADHDMIDLEEELGDLLLQIIYHCQMAEEEQLFTFGDVVMGITQKMIRRHPHVFGNIQARSTDSAKVVWEKIKAEENAEKAKKRTDAGLKKTEKIESVLDNVPSVLPANSRALKLQQKAAQVGFDWDDPNLVLDKLEEEIQELKQAIASKNTTEMKDELGDIGFALVNLARHLDVDMEDALRGTNNKFVKRFSYIEMALAARGSSPTKASLSEMETLWQEAKVTPHATT